MNDTTIKVSIESKLAYLPLIRKTIRGICSSVVENEKIFQDIDLSLNEALSNVIYHAYSNEPGHEIQILVTLFPQEVLFQIVDKGLKNPKTTPPSSPSEPNLDDLESLTESGRGLFLIHQLMDEVVYTTEEDQNVLLLRKRF